MAPPKPTRSDPSERGPTWPGSGSSSKEEEEEKHLFAPICFLQTVETMAAKVEEEAEAEGKAMGTPKTTRSSHLASPALQNKRSRLKKNLLN